MSPVEWVLAGIGAWFLLVLPLGVLVGKVMYHNLSEDPPDFGTRLPD